MHTSEFLVKFCDSYIARLFVLSEAKTFFYNTLGRNRRYPNLLIWRNKLIALLQKAANLIGKTKLGFHQVDFLQQLTLSSKIQITH